MSCILRVSGEFLDTSALLSIVDLEPNRIWQKGEPRLKSRPNGLLNKSSGVTFIASNASFRDFDTQLLEATEFLNRNQDCLERIRNFPSVDDMTLDFGIALRDVAIQSDRLTPEFLRAASSTGVAVELSHYAHHPNQQQTSQCPPQV